MNLAFLNLMMKQKAALILIASAFLFIGPSNAVAYQQFQKEFQKSYAGRENPEYRKIVRKAKCFVCHQGKDNDHKYNNCYGEALATLLGEEDKKNKEKINEALVQVAAMPVEVSDPESKTYGDLILAGELPGGSLEDCKKDPPGIATEADQPDTSDDKKE